MFHWTGDHDVLYGVTVAADAPEFRVRETVLEHVDELVQMNIELFDAAENEQSSTWIRHVERCSVGAGSAAVNSSTNGEQSTAAPQTETSRCAIQ
jgi:hypothetical protein